MLVSSECSVCLCPVSVQCACVQCVFSVTVLISNVLVSLQPIMYSVFTTVCAVSCVFSWFWHSLLMSADYWPSQVFSWKYYSCWLLYSDSDSM